MIKKLISSFFLAGLLAISLPVLAQDKMIDQIVAVVGKNIILKSEIENMLIDQQQNGVTSEGDMRCEILENLLIQQLLVAEADLDTNIVITDSQVNERMEQQVQYYVSRLGSEQEVERVYKKSIIDLKSSWQEAIRTSLKTQRMQSTIVEKVTTTPSEVRVFYKGLRQDQIPEIEEQIEYAQITVQPKISDVEDERVKAQLRDFKRRIENGESSFAGLAMTYSEDPGSVNRGGELDYFPRNGLDPAYSSAAFNLKGDKISNVVKSERGYHIIQVIDRKGELIKTRHILMKPKVSDEALKNALSQIDSIADFVRRGTVKFDAAAARWSYDKSSRNAGGLVFNGETGETKWKLTELDPDVSKVVTKMNINEISKPFLTRDENGQPVYKIVKLIERTPAHKANVRDDYLFLSERFLEKKKEDTFMKWISDKQKATYIHLDNTYLNCDFKYKGWIK